MSTPASVSIAEAQWASRMSLSSLGERGSVQTDTERREGMCQDGSNVMNSKNSLDLRQWKDIVLLKILSGLLLGDDS